VERRRAGGTRRGDLGRDAKMPEDPADDGCLLDERDQAQAAATPGTRQHVKPKCALHQRLRDSEPFAKMAEREGFEPPCRLPDNTLSRRARYDHFGTSPYFALAVACGDFAPPLA
jgi:hypothetical protein